MFRIPVSQPKIGNIELELVADCLRRNQLTQGPMVARFEREFADYLGVRHAVATTSGTTALHLALVALGIGPGDEVLVPDLTFVATANAVSYTGATVMLVDVDLATWCIDVADAARKVTPRTKAIIPVHLYGVPCDIDAVVNLAALHNLAVVEDAAEGLGGEYRGSYLGIDKLGCIGDCSTFSWYANKIATTGEGGMVATDSDKLNERLRHLRGQALDLSVARYYHDEVGFNYRMTEIQAAIGVAQLSRLNDILSARRAIFSRYAHNLDGVLPSPPCSTNVAAAPWQYTTMLPAGVSRDGCAAYLVARGIETRPVFVPLHRLPMYQGLDRDFPVACTIADSGISLPTYADLPLSAVDEVCEHVVDWLARQTTSSEVP